ncbi:GNAT family N-acetyltransferase [Lentibacillus sp. N15]|uniref:GNAT family N-acetyltransferase n=1 Tax=Lentibacillus songyuanensis TaxID=3136161 RepID=UPI0031BBC8ED
MRKKIASGALLNEQAFTVECLTITDLPDIMRLQANVSATLPSRSILSPLNEEEFTRILTGNGLMVGVFIDGIMVAFRAMLKPEIDDAHLGIDAGLEKAELPKVIYSEISSVDPDYRGNALQNYMGKLLMKEINKQQYRYVCATVSPINVPSIKDKFSLRMEVVALKEKYTGLMRYIFMRDFTVRSKDRLYQETQWIPVEEIEKQQQALASGFRGTSIEERDGKWCVKYEQ